MARLLHPEQLYFVCCLVGGAQLDHTPACTETFEYGAKSIGQANSQSGNQNGLRVYSHMQQRIPKDMRTNDGHSIHGLHVPDCNGVKGAGATQTCVVNEDKWTISWRLTLPSTSHREPEPSDTHASIVNLWVLQQTAHHPFPLFRSGPLS